MEVVNEVGIKEIKQEVRAVFDGSDRNKWTRHELHDRHSG